MKAEKILRWIFFWIGVYFTIVFLVYLISHGQAIFSARFFALIVPICAVFDLVCQLSSRTQESLCAVQFGKTVYIKSGDKIIAVATLDSERILTENELEQILRDVEVRRNAKPK